MNPTVPIKKNHATLKKEIKSTKNTFHLIYLNTVGFGVIFELLNTLYLNVPQL